MLDGTQPIEYEGVPYQKPGKELGRDDFSKMPNGLPGLGDRMIVLWSEGVARGRLTLNRFVEITATNPAKIFGMYPRKGTVAIGADADLAIWNPAVKKTYGQALSKQRVDYNLYEGCEVTGWPVKSLPARRVVGRWGTVARSGGQRNVYQAIARYVDLKLGFQTANDRDTRNAP